MKVTTLCSLLIALTTAALRAAPSPDDLARFVAGLPVKDAALAAHGNASGWGKYAADVERKWQRMDQRQLLPARTWVTGNPELSKMSGTLFYMFSGPDFLYAQTLFPHASTYILCGTEPIGSVPDISQMPPEHIEADLANVRKALDTMLTTHYFITKDMRVDLTRGNISGTLPILYFFLARTGCTVESVKLSGPSVQIDFKGPDGKAKTLYYVKTDLSNGGSNSDFLSFCKKHAPGAALLKSASYLMHTNEFSKIRNWLLANSTMIVQDDSGIPLKDFDPKRWNVRLYGSYADVLPMFQSYYQADLAAAYSRGPISPLGFAFGYAWQIPKGLLIQATPK